jgi:hypothetical protein
VVCGPGVIATALWTLALAKNARPKRGQRTGLGTPPGGELPQRLRSEAKRQRPAQVALGHMPIRQRERRSDRGEQNVRWQLSWRATTQSGHNLHTQLSRGLCVLILAAALLLKGTQHAAGPALVCPHFSTRGLFHSARARRSTVDALGICLVRFHQPPAGIG